MKRGLFASLTLGIMATAGTALADDDRPVVDGKASVDVDVNVPPPPVITTDANVYVEPTSRTTVSTTTVDHSLDRDDSMMSGIGVAVTAGAGTGGFTNDTMRDNTEDGGNWDVRATIGTQLPIAFEASYIGSAQYLDNFDINNDALLVGNGAQGAVRVNIVSGRRLTPFVFGGAAWRHYSLTAIDQNTSNFEDDDDVLEIPMGGGFAVRSGNVMLDLRGEYRATFKEDLVPSANTDNGENAPMNRWGATMNAGIAF